MPKPLIGSTPATITDLIAYRARKDAPSLISEPRKDESRTRNTPDAASNTTAHDEEDDVSQHKGNVSQAEDRFNRKNDSGTVRNTQEEPEDELNEDLLGRQFVADHPQYRYTYEKEHWLRWDETHWRQDKANRILDDIGLFLKQRTKEQQKRRGWLRASTRVSVERIAKVAPEACIGIEQLDADDWLLNTPKGTVELRVIEMREARPKDWITRTTAVGPGEVCPRWLMFLNQIAAEDRELIDFLQRMVGYCLTGSIREHALFFLYGTGTNGKSVFLNTIRRLLGEYAKIAPMETFAESKHDRHPHELARLHGARLVVASEVEEGRHWAENRIKMLTGGDTVAARPMYGKRFFEYTPKFKILIAGNHKPHLHNVDEAIRRRLHLVPFTVTIPKNEIDRDLEDKLREELPGILSWALEGCLRWQQEGLNPPAVVRNATEQYFSDQDMIQQWLDEECVRGPNLQVRSPDLRRSWRGFAKKRELAAYRDQDFPDKLVPKGIGYDRKKRMFHGVALKAAEETREG